MRLVVASAQKSVESFRRIEKRKTKYVWSIANLPD